MNVEELLKTFVKLQVVKCGKDYGVHLKDYDAIGSSSCYGATLNEALENALKQYQKEKERRSQEYTLGKLIADLEKLPMYKEVIIEDGVYPEALDSWRGNYREIGMEYGSKKITVIEFLRLAEMAVGSMCIGYKGGEFTMTKHTTMFLSNYGETEYENKAGHKSLAQVVGIDSDGEKCIIKWKDKR